MHLGVINGESFFQNIFFTWIYAYLKKGSKQTATVEEMPTLPKDLETEH